MKAFSHRQREAAHRLKENNDFNEILKYLKMELEDTKTELLSSEKIETLQGHGRCLDQLIRYLESPPK